MRVFVADFETTPFLDNSENNYELTALFCCFIQIFDSKSKNPLEQKKYFFNLKEKGTQEIKQFILDNSNIRNPSRFYFHNLKFDIAFLYDLLPNSNDYKYDIVKNNSKIIQFKIFKEYKRIEKSGKERIYRKTLLDIRDSLVLFISSIKKLGISVNLPKLEIDYNSEINEQFIEYCYRDCEILSKALFNLIHFCYTEFNYIISIDDIPLTLPALAKRLFHNIIEQQYTKGIYNNLYGYSDSNQEIEKLLRPFYYGGRVEVFDFNICHNGYYNDFNSHYPNIMCENEFPIAPYKTYECNEQDVCWTYWKNDKRFFGAICSITENLDIPLIATKIKDKLVFAKGTKVCFLFRKEIDYLLSLKQKVRLLVLFECHQLIDLFSVFIKSAYRIKQENNVDSFEYLFSKILMNSLYGKFAEKKEKEHIEIVHTLNDLSDDELKHILCYDDSDTYILRKTKEHKYIKTNIIYSMMITALARLKLHQYIVKSENPHYSDSDSIVSKELIENSLELGKMKPEFQFSKFQALGCKEYIIELQDKSNLIKMKGFGRISVENFNDFIVNYKEGKRQNRMIGFMESFVRKLPFKTVLVYDKYKTNVYDKRWINSDLTTKPFDLNNDDFDDLIENNAKMIGKIIETYSQLES